jgi:hypothetical protein
VRICPLLSQSHPVLDGWFPLQPRTQNEKVSGEIKLQISFEKISKKHYGPEDFEVLRLIGKGRSRLRLLCVNPLLMVILQVRLARYIKFARRTRTGYML